jgi:hypothetical protein
LRFGICANGFKNCGLDFSRLAFPGFAQDRNIDPEYVPNLIALADRRLDLDVKAARSIVPDQVGEKPA